MYPLGMAAQKRLQKTLSRGDAQATRVSQCRQIATMIARLTGSARLLAMSWSQAEFNTDRGVIERLYRDLQSVAIGNAAATATQYCVVEMSRLATSWFVRCSPTRSSNKHC